MGSASQPDSAPGDKRKKAPTPSQKPDHRDNPAEAKKQAEAAEAAATETAPEVDERNALDGPPAEGEATTPATQNDPEAQQEDLKEVALSDEEKSVLAGDYGPEGGDDDEALTPRGRKVGRFDGVDSGVEGDPDAQLIANRSFYALAVLRRRNEIRGLGPADFDRVWEELQLPPWEEVRSWLGSGAV